MEFSAKQIADFLKGEIIGNPDVKVNNFAKIEEGKPQTDVPRRLPALVLCGQSCR